MATTIREARISKGLTQEEVCALTGIAHKTISRLENDKGPFNKVTLKTVCRVLGVRPEDITGVTLRGVK